ncbi:MAG: DsrE family protein [Segetibacter sp.]|nr:DsrE family protein [Segetibacter sp.]
MKYFLLLVTGFIIFSSNIKAQENQHKIIFDISSSDTAEHSTVIRQVNNVLASSPKTKIEVVFHGKAVYALVKDKTTFKEKIDELVNEKNVVIAACNNSLTRLKISKDELIQSAIVVPVAILELMDKQEKGWSYIKAGQ